MQQKLLFIAISSFAAVLNMMSAQAETSSPLKVCVAENEMPYANKQGEGFENKLGLLVGKALNRPVEFVYWTDPRFYVRDYLDKNLCDVTLGVDAGDPRLLTTKPYYRSGYVFISKEKEDLDLKTWDSEILRKVKRIAYVPGTPAEEMIRAINRYNDNFSYTQELVGFKSRRNQYVKYETSKLVGEVASGRAGVAVLWGPAAARYVKGSSEPLTMTMIPDDSKRADGNKVPHHFSTAMGVRKADGALQTALNKVIEDQADEIADLLEEEGIPLLDEPKKP